MPDSELRTVQEELVRQRRDLDWILSILNRHGTAHPVKGPRELLDRVHDLEQEVAALKHLLVDQRHAESESQSPPRRAVRRAHYGGAFFARAVRRPLEFLLRKHPRD